MKKMIIIVILCIVTCGSAILFTITKQKTNYLEPDEYKAILSELGYSEDNGVLDQKFEDGENKEELTRWIGLTEKGLYASIFSFKTESAAIKKQKSVKEFIGNSKLRERRKNFTYVFK